MGGDVAMDQTSATVLDHHEHVEQSERGRHDQEEIAGNDALGMQAQERRPPQVAPRSVWRATGQILPHGSWRNLNSQLQQKLIGNAFLAPRRVLVRHAADQSL
jgi:hypothetical protein